MRITQDRNVVVITIITACTLAAFWPMGASTARPEAKELFLRGEAPILSAPAAPVTTDEPSKLRAAEAYGKLPLSFEVNQGQTDRRVKFLSRGAGYSLFLTSNEAVLSLEQNRGAGDAQERRDTGSRRIANDVLRMKVVGANPTPKIEGSDELPGKSNYFIGKNPKNWRVNVSTFARVHYREVYPGVDVVYYGNQRKLENDFIVAPGTNPDVIALAFDGANKISVDEEGSLVLGLASGPSSDVRLQRPVIYQVIDGVRREVSGNYVMRSGRDVGFAVTAYDLSRPLVIDPVLVYSSYLGGNGADVGEAIAVDDSGNAYITGDTESSIFPTVSPIDSTLGGTADAFVVKINPAGSALVYSTYLGGSSTETGRDIAVDAAGNAYVTGLTSSNDFPVMNAFNSALSRAGSTDAYVARLNPDGSALVYSTYLAGNFGARGCGIAAIGSQGFAYVTGTTSVNFPVTASAFESTNFNSGFLTKLCTNCSGASSLVYSTFLAHTGSAEGRAIAADVAGNVYITGNLNSTTTNFATPGAFQTTFGGGSADAFVAKFNTNLSGAAGLVYATYLGGTAKDIGGADGSLNPGRAIAIDESGNAYITGSTSSTNFPLVNASQGVIGGQNDAFLTKLNSTGSGLIYSTYLGGIDDDFGKSVAVNVAGSAYVTGVGGSHFPTLNALPTPLAGVGFVTKFTPAGAVMYSTLLSGVTQGSSSIALDLAGNAFATGSTNASIVTAFPFQPTTGGGGTEGWVTVIADPTIIGRVSDENGNPLPGATVNLSGVPTATTTTDANGGYTFGLLTVGNSYTVSVVVPNYIFGSAGVNNLVKNVRRDFGPAINSIGGQVKLGSGGLSVSIRLIDNAGKSLIILSDANGFYSFNNLPAGRDYEITPAWPRFSFEPDRKIFFNLLVDQTVNFVATADLHFRFSSFSVNEAAGRATITVERDSGASGPASIDYATSDSSALQRTDYTTTIGTLNFAVDETSKSIDVPIIDDVYVEGNEIFGVTLSNPSGAIVFGGNETRVTIIDNDTVPPTTNPLDNADAQFFVRQHYLDFLSREPDAAGLAFWTNEITSCGSNQSCIDAKRVNVSAAFFLSIEFQETGYLVYKMYKASYGNLNGAPVPVRYGELLPDSQQIAAGVQVGIGNWQAQLENNKAAFALAFVSRARFMTAFPISMTPTQFVDALYANGGVTPGAAERTSVINEFAGAGNTADTAARGRAVRRVAENSSFTQQEFNRAFVLMQYFGYLRRNPNDAPEAGLNFDGYNFWLGKLNQFNGNFVNADMVKAFIVSSEYRQRFGP